MRNIALLVRKDFLSAATVHGSYLFYLLFGLATIIFIRDMIPFLFVLLVYSMVIALFQTEENDLVCNVTAILPIRKRDAVLARYVYLYLVIAVLVAVSLLSGALINPFRKEAVAVFLPVLAAVTPVLLMTSITIPLIYRFGMVKMRVLVMVVYMVMIVGSSLAAPLVRRLPSLDAAAMLWAGLGVGVALSLASMAISMRIKKSN